jgi:[glutamine synthetase] adenylyltransferase / [glutamine synthetase]-adenylyl-L-tyrosine phosphorylase
MSGAEALRARVAELRSAWESSLAAQGLAAPRAARVLDALGQVWEASDYVAQACIREPGLLPGLADSGRLTRANTEGEVAALLDGALAQGLAGAANETALAAVLRRFRRGEMVRIIWRDLAGWAPLGETLEDLTALADACIGAALGLLQGWTRREFGTPLDAEGRPQGLVVLGMGKLGARELNLSSDIDLIFAYPHNGAVEGDPRALTCEQFFVRLGQRLVQALNNQTADGFVFRVDTRLRPFGSAGPLAMSFSAMEDYYQSQAREWERYAMIKARVVAGDPAAGAQLTALLRPFVFRRYLDYGAIDSLRELKRLIAKELHRKGMSANIKLGPGGIREIEFIGQALQLVRGGRDPGLQIRPILPVLERLGALALLPPESVTLLAEAYRFLRRVENRLQAWKDQQTHVLPNDPQSRLRLARSMGFPDWPALADTLDAHRARVQAEFDQLFGAPYPGARVQGTEGDEDGPKPRRGTHPLAPVWAGTAVDLRPHARPHSLDLLGQAGFREPESILDQLDTFRGVAERKGLSTRGADRLAQIVPPMLELIARDPHPVQTLERVLRILEAAVSRTAYLSMLVEGQEILARLVHLTALSPWVAAQIARHPILLDELLDRRRTESMPEKPELTAELDALLAAVDPDDLEQQMDRLRQFARGNTLRVAAADLDGRIPLMKVSDYLTWIAEVAVARALSLTWEHLAARHGPPSGVGGANTGFLVLGYGKLGGIELGYGSDLDLVFLHRATTATAMTAGPQAIADQQFYARLGQRLIHMLSTQTAAGALYEVDMRLRPDGAKGVLARSLTSFADYQAKEAWTWEHQALVRARAIAGDPLLAEQFAAVRRSILCRERDPVTLRREVREMRTKMRAQLDRSSRAQRAPNANLHSGAGPGEGGASGRFDLKQGAGGIADIEFMVQYAVLRWAAAHPALARWSDNIRILETLAGLQLLPAGAAEDLTSAYKALRSAYHRTSLQDGPTLIRDDRLVAERECVKALWQELMEGGEP